MKKESSDILIEFEEKKALLKEFGKSVYDLTLKLLKDKIQTHQISYRIKDKDSLVNKLIKKSEKYTNISEVTDLVGLRIVTYFEDDIDKIAEILASQFEIDFPNSVDKRIIDADKFGYRSLHYVANVNKERCKLPEYIVFSDFKLEIQIRSILQHSWAEIEHDLGYKGEHEIPPTAKRTFYRVAALLEQADIEFVKLRQLIKMHETTIRSEIRSPKSALEISIPTIIAFIKESRKLFEIEKELETESCKRGPLSDASIVASTVLMLLEENNIRTLYELENYLQKNRRNLIEWSKLYYSTFPKPKPSQFVPGAAIVWMFSLLQGKEPNAKLMRR